MRQVGRLWLRLCIWEAEEVATAARSGQPGTPVIRRDRRLPSRREWDENLDPRSMRLGCSDVEGRRWSSTRAQGAVGVRLRFRLDLVAPRRTRPTSWCAASCGRRQYKVKKPKLEEFRVWYADDEGIEIAATASEEDKGRSR